MSDSDESDVPDLWAYPDPAAVEQPKDEVEEEVEVIAETKQETRVGTRKRTQKEIEMDRWLEGAAANDRKNPKLASAATTSSDAKGTAKQKSGDVLEELGLSSPPLDAAGASDKKPRAKPAAKSAAMAKVEKMFEELEKSDDDEPLPPVVNPVARGGAAGPSGRGEAGGKPAKADGGDDEDEEEPEVVEEPIQILVRFSEKCQKKIKMKPTQPFLKIIDYVNTCTEGKQLAEGRGGRRLVLKFDGDLIAADATPESMGIEEGDIVDVS